MAPSRAERPSSGGQATAQAVLERLGRLHPRVIDLSLDRMGRLLGDLGSPHERLAPVAHVAGTNGKGSTLALARAMLEADGKRAQVFTSPHLIELRECVRLADGRLIADDHLADLLERCERVNAGRALTAFEALTAAALLAFAEETADVTLIEVGLGGALDATNVIARPAVSVITRVSFDHGEYLGPSLAHIAEAKAGIIKPGRPVVLAPQEDPVVVKVVAERARALAAPLLAAPEAWRVETGTRGFTYEGGGRRLDLPWPGLVGRHQAVNAATAIAALDAFAPVGAAAIARGLATARWPGRLQSLPMDVWEADLPAGVDIWLDGGHNDSAGQILADQAEAWSRAPPAKPLALIVGMLANKDARAFLGPLAGRISAVRAVPTPGIAAAPGMAPERLADLGRELGVEDAATARDVGAAVRELAGLNGGVCRVLICGSLSLAGAVLKDVDPEIA